MIRQKEGKRENGKTMMDWNERRDKQWINEKEIILHLKY